MREESKVETKEKEIDYVKHLCSHSEAAFGITLLNNQGLSNITARKYAMTNF